MQISPKAVSLHCVFHSIRFKVNKGWSKALLLFLFSDVYFLHKKIKEFRDIFLRCFKIPIHHYHLQKPALQS
ncbi:hypothetical protein DW702_03245 [Bacteroides salyersiae]|nr:hypothetical protein DW702_03245 [Bacteroides salyersiae]RYT46030.1 hypothetical protein EAJ08_17305 [Bacteroides salyersiae]